MRLRPLLVVASVGILLGLSACAQSPTTSAAGDSCTPTASGAESDAISVSGALGSKPKVRFTAPLTTKKTERTVVKKGKGRVAEPGSSVTAEFTIFDGKTGKELGSTGHDGSNPQQIPLTSSTLPGIVDALECSQAGSRVAAVIAPSDGFGSTGSSQIGVGPNETLVVVADVVSVPKPALSRAHGTATPPPAGYPTVTLAKNGAPTITIPQADPPTDLEIATLIQGDGATVASGASVTVQYTGVVWQTGKVFDSSWERGQPATFTTDQVIPGFAKALVGQKVGSQVMAIIPPAEGYGSAGNGEDISGDSVLVFVVDILGVS